MERQHISLTYIQTLSMRLLILVTVVLGVSIGANAQVPADRDCSIAFTEENYAFADREEATYLANYKWGLISTDVGEATIRVNRIINESRPYYFVEVTAKTYKFYDKVFKVRDTYTSRFSAETFLPQYFHRNIFEGGYAKRSTLNFDWQKDQLKSTTQRRKDPPVDTILPLQKCTFDLLSPLFYSRNLDFTFVKPGDIFPMVFALDDEIYNLKYRYIGKETVSVDGLGNFRCLKFGIQVVAGSVFKGDEEVTLWVTDDRNHFPIKAESPIIVGKVRVTLMKMSNTKHPFTSMN